MDPGSIEERAERAHALEREVVVGSMSVRRTWIHMAAGLHAIRAEGLYELLGYERFTEWIASPEISMGRSQAYSLTAIYEELVIERGVKVEDIQYLEPSKLGEIIPAIRKGADITDCLYDAQELSRSDLRQKYRGDPEPEDEGPQAICPECGQSIKKGK